MNYTCLTDINTYKIMSNKITAIIVEDEELPRLSLIEKLKRYHPGVIILDACDNCDTALDSILHHSPDILFLDIELPEKNSLWLLNQLKEVSSMPLPQIIFTTAFNDSDYLLKAIKLEAVDYLLKPVNLEELTKALQKVRRKLEENRSNTERTFTFKTANSILKVKESELIYCEADGYCSKILLSNNKSELVFDHLKNIETMICSETIVRAGRKYIINSKYIFKIDTKKHICHFLLPSGTIVGINLSEGGMDTAMAFMNDYHKVQDSQQQR